MKVIEPLDPKCGIVKCELHREPKPSTCRECVRAARFPTIRLEEQDRGRFRIVRNGRRILVTDTRTKSCFGKK